MRKPLDILHHTYEFYTALMPSHTRDVLANGIIACVPGIQLSPLYSTIKDHRKYSEDIIKRTGYPFPAVVLRCSIPHMTDSKIIAFPKSYFLLLHQHNTYTTPEEQEANIVPEALASIIGQIRGV